MIRINLLTAERERGHKGRFVIAAAQRITAVAVLIVVLTVSGIGWWFWTLRDQSARLDEEIAKAEVETQQLRGVLAEVQKFESRKTQLQQRVTLIEQLRKGQGTPVRVLDDVSRSVPERLWLTELKQTGNDFAIGGLSTSLTALSDFVANLEATGTFARPVEIIDSQVQSDSKAAELVKFSIKASLHETAVEVPPSGGKPGSGARPGTGTKPAARRGA